jgi:hypothetical protein
MLKTRRELEGEDLTDLYIQYMEEREEGGVATTAG